MTAHYDVDTIVVGAGAVGLATARTLARNGHEVIVVERHQRIGQESSSRNSGVIHSGIYYPKQSLKALLCVRGRDLLYEFCEQHDIQHQRVGKLIVAQEAQTAALRALSDRGVSNGVHDLEWLNSDEVGRLEPRVRCAAALFSPSTGIVDVHEYLTALWGDLEASEGRVVFDTTLLRASYARNSFFVSIRSGAEDTEVRCRWLINAAGLHAIGLLEMIDVYPRLLYKQLRLAKGNYFTFKGRNPFKHLIYPMPSGGGLGIHATLDLAGNVRFGPDVEWVETIDYSVNPDRVHQFYDAIREYWPLIPDDSLAPAYAGIRPKLSGSVDFIVEDESVHSIPGLINLLGIESPGITASLAIAEQVLRKVDPDRDTSRLAMQN